MIYHLEVNNHKYDNTLPVYISSRSNTTNPFLRRRSLPLILFGASPKYCIISIILCIQLFQSHEIIHDQANKISFGKETQNGAEKGMSSIISLVSI